jgi:hypothetical protein
MGCGIGCAVLVLLVILAGVAFWAKVVRPMQQAGAEVEAMMEANKATIAQIVALDSTYPSSLADDIDGAELTSSQIDSYIAIREALGPQAAAVAQAKADLAASLDMSAVGGGGSAAMGAVFGMMKTVATGAKAQMTARGELLGAAAGELEAASMGQAELAAMVEIVEWRFLQNDDAIIVALDAAERGDWAAQTVALKFASSILEGAGAQMGASDRAQMERSVEDASERLDDLKAAAQERTTLTAATRSLLESRRAELEALPQAGMAELATLSDSSNPMKALEGLGGLGG